MNFLPSARHLLAAASLITFFSCNNASNQTETSEVVADTNAAKSMIDSAQNMKMPDTAQAGPDTTSVPFVKHAEAMLAGTYADTSVTGVAKFDAEENGKIKMTLEITVPAKAGKSVAVHIHEHGDCGDKGNMSHGHWNPTKMQHGKWGSANFHSGDIGNVKLDKSGKGKVSIETDLWTLGGTVDKNILGKALIVHGGVDDYTTQPSGNAGTRIGCGVIK